MKTLWISLCVAWTVASVDAQRGFNLSKPIINLEKRPRPMTWLRPPEERRKLSIFPKNNMKFVVTPKTPIKTDETETPALSTKRPLMRKFIVRNKNEKGSWHFAPREPLMKTKRFGVTMAPQRLTGSKDDSKYSQSNGEMADESKKVKTVINNAKTRPVNKVPGNKGNLIDVSRNVATSKSIPQFSKVAENASINKAVNNRSKNAILDNLSNAGDYPIRTENASKSDVFSKITSKIGNGNASKVINKPVPPSNIEEILSKAIEDRSLGLDDISLDDRHENINFDGSSNAKELETFIENMLNIHTTETSLEILKDESAFSNQEENFTGMTQNVDDFTSEPLLSTTELEIENHDYVTSYISNGPQTDLPGEVLSGNVGTESFIQTTHILKSEDLPPEPESSDDTSFLDKSLRSQSTTTNEFFVDVMIDELIPVTEETIELLTNMSENETNEDVSKESPVDKSNNQTSEEDSNESYLTRDELPNESISDKSNNLTEETSNESFIEESINYTDEVSNEYTVDKVNNLSGEEIPNESNMAGEEISNESISDKTNNLTEETSNESLIDKSNNLTDEVSNESSMENLNEGIANEPDTAGEDISNEFVENSNNLSEEVSNSEVLIDISVTNEDVSDKATFDKSNHFTVKDVSDKPNFDLGRSILHRFQRSNNIIEEETVQTTVSGFKYADHEVRQNHDFSFKNINV